MDRLPEDIAAPLTKAVGSFIRASARQELPGSLRRFQSYRPQTLQRHRGELLAALDDERVRAKVLDWLADDPVGLQRNEQELLREAVERRDGWHERLSDRSAPPPERRPARRRPADAELVARQTDKARRAVRDAKAVREQARAEIAAQRAKTAALVERERALQGELAAARREAEAERRRAAQEIGELERKLRRALRDAARAKAERDAARAELKQERRGVAGLARRVEHLERERVEASTPATRAREPDARGASSSPRRDARVRRPLRAPGGRLEDDPDTLDDWLATTGVRVLVDGYNVTKAPGGFGELGLEAQRRRLVGGLDVLARRRRAPITVVFDGSEVPPGTSRRSRGPVQVRYSAPTETADDHLVALLDGLPPDPVVVVTNDRELRRRVSALGATVAGSGQLLSLLR
jgi:predicted RNA-binding protein with PIN domain